MHSVVNYGHSKENKPTGTSPQGQKEGNMNKNMNELINLVEAKGFTIKESGSTISFWAQKGNLTIEVGIFQTYRSKVDRLTLNTYFTDEEGCHGYYNPTFYVEGTIAKIDNSKDYTPTPEALAKLIDEVEYMQTNSIKCYKKGA